MSDHSGRNLRNGRTAGRSKPARESKAKKPAKPKEPAKSLYLPGTISELVKDSTSPLFDIEAYIHRGDDERRDEVTSNDQKIKRPMNSYIMYRKVYQERVKEYSNEQNHQTISQLVSSSWKQEPQELKDKFQQYAQIEREGLMRAYPSYKFQPKAKDKKRNRDGLSDDDLSDQDGSDPEWGGLRHRRNRSKNVRAGGGNAHMSDPNFFASRESSFGWEEDYHHHLAYPHSGLGRPPPMPMNPAHAQPAYYQHMGPSGIHGEASGAYHDDLGHDAVDPLLNPHHMGGHPSVPDAMFNDPDPAAGMDPMLQEPWSGGAFTADQFQDYQYGEFDSQLPFREEQQQQGENQQVGHVGGTFQDNHDVESLLRDSLGR